jgi:hypothetical protein
LFTNTYDFILLFYQTKLHSESLLRQLEHEQARVQVCVNDRKFKLSQIFSGLHCQRDINASLCQSVPVSSLRLTNFELHENLKMEIDDVDEPFVEKEWIGQGRKYDWADFGRPECAPLG